MAISKKLADHKISGFDEEAAPPLVAAKPPDTWRLRIGSDGRVVIPAVLRARLDLDADGLLTATVVDGQLLAKSPRVAARRLQEIAAKYKVPGKSMVDELIAERRTEASRDGNS